MLTITSRGRLANRALRYSTNGASGFSSLKRAVTREFSMMSSGHGDCRFQFRADVFGIFAPGLEILPKRMKQHNALVLGSEGNLARKQRHQEKDNSCLWARTSYCPDEDAPSHCLPPPEVTTPSWLGHCITTRRAKEQGEAVRLTNVR